MPITLKFETLRQEDEDQISGFKKKKKPTTEFKKHHLTDSWEMTSGLYMHTYVYIPKCVPAHN